uniref:Origin recognition complex subunit 2 n=1 Tax=Parastrongyloides trichosuri TaxID=131310 RepID=A0A0N4ZQ45_PARTI
MSSEKQFHEIDGESIYDVGFPYKELGIIFNNKPFINRNVIIHGIGSKRKILERLMEDQLSNIHCTYVDGKSIRFDSRVLLDQIVYEFKIDINYTKNDFIAYTMMIIEELEKVKNLNLAIIIDNCDRANLIENTIFQDCLALLTSKKNIFFIGTCMRPFFPAPGSDAYEKLNCYFYQYSTFMFTESDDEKDDLMEDNVQNHNVESIEAVFECLTRNAQKVFVLLLKEFVKNNYKDIFLEDVYEVTRNAFLVNSYQVLQDMMVEFIDHGHIEQRPGATNMRLSLKIKKQIVNEFLESKGLSLEGSDEE